MTEKHLNGKEFNRLDNEEKWFYLLGLKRNAAIAAQYADELAERAEQLQIENKPDWFQFYWLDLEDVLGECVDKLLTNNEPLPVPEAGKLDYQALVKFYRDGDLWPSG